MDSNELPRRPAALFQQQQQRQLGTFHARVRILLASVRPVVQLEANPVAT